MSDQSKFITGLLLGAAAGAAIAYFMTTEKGQEIMEDLKSAAANAGDEVKEKMKQFESEIESAVEKGKRWAGEFGEKEENPETQTT